MYSNLSGEALNKELALVSAAYQKYKNKNLQLNIARGKPSAAQLDMVSDILTVLQKPEQCMTDGIDARNYGELEGLPAARRFFAELLGCRPEECFIGGNASLTLMYDTIAKAYTHGLLHSERPWCKEETVKWLCPVPGYDRHFKITESFGFEMICIPMTDDGPDMDLVEELVLDPSVKGMWCVPKYSNPDGIVYSDETIDRIASMKTAAPDFLVMWDNAYCVHEFDGDFLPFRDILTICREAGNPDRVFEYASTSKITLPGAGVSVMAASEANQAHMKTLLTAQLISYDKVNQLRHVLYLQNKEHTLEVMKKHAEIMKPKFDCVLQILEKNIESLGIASWRKPKGGYFVSLNTAPGLANRTWTLLKEAGVTMTSAGATFPYGKDPEDSNIRIAPSLPPLEELQEAMEVFCICLRLAALEQKTQILIEQPLTCLPTGKLKAAP